MHLYSIILAACIWVEFVSGETKAISSNSTCPHNFGAPETPICAASDCQAIKGGKCAVGLYKGCECTASTISFPQTVSLGWLDFQDSILSPIVVACGEMSKTKATLWWKAVQKICAANIFDVGETNIILVTAKEVDANDLSGDKFEFGFISHGKRGSCNSSCLNTYLLFYDHRICYNGDSVTSDGILPLDCGTVFFSITPAKAKKIPSTPTMTTTGGLIPTGFVPALNLLATGR